MAFIGKDGFVGDRSVGELFDVRAESSGRQLACVVLEQSGDLAVD